MKELSLKERLSEIDNGRWADIVEAMRVKDVCLKCYTFNHMLDKDDLNHRYLCRCSPHCIGDTLSSEIKSYLLWKLGEKTDAEHRYWLGL